MPQRHALSVTLAVVCLLAPGAGGAQTAAAPVFQLQNNFWMNLHEFLRGEARRASTRGVPRMRTGLFAEAERVAWSKSLAAYGDLARRDPAADAELIGMANTLARESTATLDHARGVAAPYADALTSAAPIYRRYLWLRHRDRNDTYITLARAAVQRRGAKLAAERAARDRVTWPARAVLVDVVSEAGAGGAYTVPGLAGAAAHVVVASDDRVTSDAAADGLYQQLADYLKRIP